MSWKGFGQRIAQAIFDRQSQIGQRLTLTQVGIAVAKRERRAKPYGVSTVAGWIEERNEPTLASFTALAAELGTTPGWLAFGEKNEVRVYTKVPEPTETAPASSQEPQRRDGGTKSRRRA